MKREIEGNAVRVIVLDLDGVITETAEFQYLAWKRLAEGEDLPFGPEDAEDSIRAARQVGFWTRRIGAGLEGAAHLTVPDLGQVTMEWIQMGLTRDQAQATLS